MFGTSWGVIIISVVLFGYFAFDSYLSYKLESQRKDDAECSKPRQQ